MNEKTVLVTGACGEIGQALVQNLSRQAGYRIVTADLAPLPEAIRSLSAEHIQGDLVNKVKLFYDYDFDIIFHLAASLSSKAEVATEEAHRINVEGTLQLLMLAAYRSEKYKKEVKFLFPSSIAAYGFTDLHAKQAAGCVKEDEYNTPHTMYGCNKLYCEKLGLYYSRYNGQRHLDPQPPVMCDFRAIRFPGLISAFTLPSGQSQPHQARPKTSVRRMTIRARAEPARTVRLASRLASISSGSSRMGRLTRFPAPPPWLDQTNRAIKAQRERYWTVLRNVIHGPATWPLRGFFLGLVGCATGLTIFSIISFLTRMTRICQIARIFS